MVGISAYPAGLLWFGKRCNRGDAVLRDVNLVRVVLAWHSFQACSGESHVPFLNRRFADVLHLIAKARERFADFYFSLVDQHITSGVAAALCNPRQLRNDLVAFGASLAGLSASLGVGS